MNINFEDLQIFLEIERNHSISGAAYTLFSTQSTVSRRLKSLEQELGTQLFTRGKGLENVTLTAAGQKFLPIARQMVALGNDAAQVKEIKESVQLSIAVTDSMLFPLLQDFFALLTPEFRPRLIVADSIPICEMVSNHTVDIGMTNDECPFAELSGRCFWEEDFVVLRRGEKKYFKDSVKPYELMPEHEIAMLCGSTFNRWHNYWWHYDNAAAVVNQANIAATLLRAPENWTILPRSTAKELLNDEGLFIQTIDDDVPKRRCLFVTSKKQRPEMAEIIEKVYGMLTEYMVG